MVRSQPRRGEQLNFAGFLLNPIGQLRTTPLASQCLVVPSSYREYNATRLFHRLKPGMRDTVTRGEGGDRGTSGG